MKMAAFVLLILSFSVGRAESLSWKSAVEQTLKGNSEIKAALSSLESSRESAKAARSGYFPSLSGSLNYTYGTTTSATSIDETANSSYGASVSLNQNIFNGLNDKAKVEQALAQVRVQEANLDTVKARVSFDLKSSYAGLLFAQRMVNLQGEIVNRREENLRLVNLRFQGGRENKGSVLLSKAYLEQARFEALQARNGILTAQAQMARVLGRDEEANLAVHEDIPLEFLTGNPNFKEIAAKTPEHRSSVASEQSADWGVTLAKSGFFPTLGLSATSGKSGPDFFPQYDRWSVGATLTIPLFSGGKDFYGTRSALGTWSAAIATRENTDRNLIAKLRAAYSSYMEASEKNKVDQSFETAAVKRAEIARGKYNNGLLTFDQWDIIENDLITRQRAVLQSQKERVNAEGVWVQTQGKGVF